MSEIPLEVFGDISLTYCQSGNKTTDDCQQTVSANNVATFATDDLPKGLEDGKLKIKCFTSKAVP